MKREFDWPFDYLSNVKSYMMHEHIYFIASTSSHHSEMLTFMPAFENKYFINSKILRSPTPDTDTQCLQFLFAICFNRQLAKQNEIRCIKLN